MPVLNASGWSVAVAGVSVAGMVETAFLAPEGADLAAAAVNGVWGIVGLVLIKAITEIGSVVRNRDSRLAEIERDRAQEKGRRQAEREVTTREILRLRNQLEAASAKLRAFQANQRTNGAALAEVADRVGVPVQVAIPPAASGDHPIIPHLVDPAEATPPCPTSPEPPPHPALGPAS